uniref:WAP domain-containing protein n=1 Tax=Oryzias latipes TaxID=8090 RepID=A0A3B3HIW3_ORYLA
MALVQILSGSFLCGVCICPGVSSHRPKICFIGKLDISIFPRFSCNRATKKSVKLLKNFVSSSCRCNRITSAFQILWDFIVLPFNFVGFYNLCSFFSVEQVCPDTTGMIGICVELCGLHGYCPNGELCCSNGCGHVCTTPITVKPGDCPDPRFTRQCGTRCRHDGNCPGEMKCCQTSCVTPT